jgi:hypothetical protein
MVLQHFQDSLQVHQMICKCLAINQDIVEKYQDEAAEKWPENIVHEGLKCGRGVRKPEGHYEEFVMTFMSAEGGLGNVLCPHPNLVVAGMKIQFGKK